MHWQRLPGKHGSYIFRQKSQMARQSRSIQGFIEELAIHASRVIEPERLMGSGADRKVLEGLTISASLQVWIYHKEFLLGTPIP